MARTAGSVPAPEVKYQIDFVIGFFLVVGAFFLDSLCFFFMLFVIGEVVAKIIKFLASIGSFIIFYSLGLKFLEGRAMQKLGIAGGMTVLGEIPLIGSLAPTLTAQTLSLIYIMRKEDKEKAKENSAKTAQKAGVQMSAQQASQAVRTRRAGNNNETVEEQKAA